MRPGNGQPTVSVIMSVYNGKRFLQEAIDSILAQTFTDFEFLIFDDGSTDGSSDILSAAAARNRRIVLERLPHTGLSAALNRGLEKARGRYVARMDADDISLPDRFEKQIRFLDSHPDIALVSGGFELIDEEGRSLKTILHPVLPEIVHHELLEHNFICHPAIMARRDALRSIGGYRAQYLHAEDWDMWLRLSERYRLANLPDVLIKYRQHLSKVSLTGYPQQLIAGIVACKAAALRRSGQEDPTDRMKSFSLDSLGALGMSREEEQAARSKFFQALFAVTADGRFPPRRLAQLWLAEGRRRPLPATSICRLVGYMEQFAYTQRRQLLWAALLSVLIVAYYPWRASRYLLSRIVWYSSRKIISKLGLTRA